MHVRSVIVLLAVGLLATGCTFVSTGARSAIVVLVRNEVTAAGAQPLPMPPRQEIKSALSRQFLWMEDDKRAAQWIAYVDVRTPRTPLEPFGLNVVEVKKNPDWQPWAISDPLPGRAGNTPAAFKLLEANEQNERALASVSR